MTRSPSRASLTGGPQDNNMKHLVKTVRRLVGARYPQPSRRTRHEAGRRDPVSGGGNPLGAPGGLWTMPGMRTSMPPVPAETPPGTAAPAPAPAAPDLAQQVQNLQAQVQQLEGRVANWKATRRPGGAKEHAVPAPSRLPRPRPNRRFPTPRRRNIIPRACASTTPRNSARPGPSFIII